MKKLPGLSEAEMKEIEAKIADVKEREYLRCINEFKQKHNLEEISEWEEGYAEGYAKGYAEGFEIGFEEGYLEERERIISKLRASGMSEEEIGELLAE